DGAPAHGWAVQSRREAAGPPHCSPAAPAPGAPAGPAVGAPYTAGPGSGPRPPFRGPPVHISTVIHRAPRAAPGAGAGALGLAAPRPTGAPRGGGRRGAMNAGGDAGRASAPARTLRKRAVDTPAPVPEVDARWARRRRTPSGAGARKERDDRAATRPPRHRRADRAR